MYKQDNKAVHANYTALGAHCTSGYGQHSREREKSIFDSTYVCDITESSKPSFLCVSCMCRYESYKFVIFPWLGFLNKLMVSCCMALTKSDRWQCNIFSRMTGID